MVAFRLIKCLTDAKMITSDPHSHKYRAFIFLGFLQGVAFGWPFEHMIRPMLLGNAVLLGVFYIIDRWVCCHG